MFDLFRKMIVPIIIVILLFFTAMIVLQWGLGLSSRQSYQDANLAAVINGEDVSWDSYSDIYKNLVRAEQPDSVLEDLPKEKKEELHQQAWKQLLHDRLLMQEVAKRDISVAPEEIYTYLKVSPPPVIRNIPDFQTEGQFDYSKYLEAMANPQAAPFWASLEPYIKDEIMKMKVQEMVLQAVCVSEEEIKSAFMAANEKVHVGMVNVDFGRFSRPSPIPNDEELHEYFESHKDDYYLEERRGLNIAILEKSPQPLDWEISYNKAKEIYDSIQTGADFAEMAEKYSEDGSSKNGGDLGWFNKGQMVPEFDKMVFSMTPDAVSEPVKTQFGWHIIKLHDTKEEMEKVKGKEDTMVKQAHASHILIKAEISQESRDQLYNKLEAFRETAGRIGFQAAIEEHDIPFRHAEPFFIAGNIQYLGNNREVAEFTFKNKLNTISDMMENTSAMFVVQVSEIKPAGPSTFEEADKKLRLDALNYKVLMICKDTADVIWAEIQAGTDIEKAAKNHGEEYTDMKPFKRDDFVAEIRHDPEAIGAAFSISEPGQMHPPTEHNQGVAIFKLIDRITPDLSDYNAKKDSIYSSILTKKQQNLYTRWFDGLVAKAEIVNNVQKAVAENPDFM